MIKYSQNITINCDQHKVWDYLIDLSRSLIFDRYYNLIEIPQSYSINSNTKFSVNAQYLLKVYQFNGRISDNISFNKIEIKFTDINSSKIFQTKSFKLINMGDKTKLEYEHCITFNNMFKNLLLYSPLKASCIAELVFLKKAIESSEHIYEGKKINTILH